MVRLSTLIPAVLATSGVVGALKPHERKPNKFAKNTVLVELEDDETVDNFYATLPQDASPRMNLTYSLFKGASIHVTPKSADTTPEEQAAEIASMPKVKKAWPVRLYSVPNDELIWSAKSVDAPVVSKLKRRADNDTVSLDGYSTHLMTQVDKLRADGVTGAGTKIAIIDTGIDYNHPALGGCFGEGCLISYGTDLVGDAFDGTNTPTPDADPRDTCQGHGTHVAGIVAAGANDYGFTGAAPDVTIGAYRVFGCFGDVGDDVLISAYMQAFEDGSDIISASIGGASGWSEDPWAVAVERIVEQGVPCIVSAGNDGAAGMWYASTAANGKGITAVASIENLKAPTLLTQSKFSVDNGELEVFGWTSGTPDNWVNMTRPLWALSFDTTKEDDGCEAFPEDTPDLSDKILLLRRGTCTFVQKITNAMVYGAKYIMIYNNVAGTANIQGLVEGFEGLGMVTAEQGAAWIEALEAGSEIVLSIKDLASETTIFEEFDNTGLAGFASDFTSWGPTFEMELKPQVGTPGGKILSTYPLDLGGYAVLSGTSMAAPILSAIFALVGEVRGTLDPKTLENVLSSTANANLFNDGTQSYPALAPVVQQGAGLVQAYAAAHVTCLLSVSSLSFNDTNNFAESLNFTITNTGDEDVSFDVGHVGAASAYTFGYPGALYPMTFPNDLFDVYATPSFSEDKVAVPAGGEAIVSVSVQPPDLDSSRLPVYGGYITLNGTNGENLSLPYIGALGSLRDVTVLGENVYASIGTDMETQPISEGMSFSLPPQGQNATDSDVLPMIFMDMAFGSAYIGVELIDSATEESLGQIEDFPVEYQPRDPVFGNFSGLMADGTYAPEGTYSFMVKALKVLGDRESEDDWETKTTSSFEISYQ